MKSFTTSSSSSLFSVLLVSVLLSLCPFLVSADTCYNCGGYDYDCGSSYYCDCDWNGPSCSWKSGSIAGIVIGIIIFVLIIICIAAACQRRRAYGRWGWRGGPYGGGMYGGGQPTVTVTQGYGPGSVPMQAIPVAYGQQAPYGGPVYAQQPMGGGQAYLQQQPTTNGGQSYEASAPPPAYDHPTMSEPYAPPTKPERGSAL